MGEETDFTYLYYELLQPMQEEIYAIKARMRAYEIHDDWCQKIGDLEHASSVFGDGPAVKIRPCNCWLVKEA